MILSDFDSLFSIIDHMEQIRAFLDAILTKFYNIFYFFGQVSRFNLSIMIKHQRQIIRINLIINIIIKNKEIEINNEVKDIKLKHKIG